jgi:hypothetical protein
MVTIINISIKPNAPSPGVGRGVCPGFDGSVTWNELSRFIGFHISLLLPGQYIPLKCTGYVPTFSPFMCKVIVLDDPGGTVK